MDWTPNPSDPALAKFLPGELISTKPDGRRVRERGHACKSCGHVTWRKFDNRAQAALDEYSPEPCEHCGKAFGERMNFHRGWIYEPMAPDFNAKNAFLPDHHKPPSLRNEKYVR